MNVPIYYHLLPITFITSYLQNTDDARDGGDWEAWILFMLKAVEETSKQTTKLIETIYHLMDDTKVRMENELPKLVSQELIQSLFKHPYTKIEFIEEELKVTRQTASKHLKALADKGFLEMVKQNRTHYYINQALCDALLHVRDL